MNLRDLLEQKRAEREQLDAQIRQKQRELTKLARARAEVDKLVGELDEYLQTRGGGR